MKSKNKVHIIFIAVGLLIALGGFITSKFSNDTEDLMFLGLAISEVAGFFMLLRNGTFIKTKYFRFLKGVFSIIIVGALFKIMHWPYAGNILTFGFLSVIGIYLASFLNKPIKKRLDYIKLFWVVVAYGGGILSLLHIITKDYQILSSVLMWLAIVDYLKSGIEKQKALNAK